MARRNRAPSPGPGPSGPALPLALGPKGWGAAAGAAAAFAALYAAFPDKVFVFDGIQFASVIERSVDAWRAELFSRRHLLFNPLMMGLRDAAAALGAAVPGYEFIQRANAVLGALGLLLFFDAARRLLRGVLPAAAAALALGLSFSYWSRASEGQVYMAMTFGALTTLWCAARLLEAPSRARAAALAAAWAAAVLIHGANAFVAPMVVLAFWHAFAKRLAPALGWASVGGAAVLASYLIAFHGKESVFDFFLKGTEYFKPAEKAGWTGLVSGFFTSGGHGPLERLSIILAQLASAFVAGIPAKASPWVGLILAGLLLSAGFRARRNGFAPEAAILSCAGLGYVFLDSFWMGGAFFWPVPAACFLLLGFLAFPAPPPRALAACAAAALALGARNLEAGVRPQSLLENNEGHRRTMFVRDHTVASSWVVISGFGFPNSKVYLAYFARRSREVLEYYLNSRPKAEGLALFAAFLDRNFKIGVPVYVLSDLVEDEAALAAVRRAWGVSPEEIRACFGPGDLVTVAAQDPGFRVHLFVPEGHRPRLYAALSYSVLTEASAARLSETAAALREIAKLMTPAERARTVAVMKSSRYGYDILREAFDPYMNAESQARASARLERFERLQRTPDFLLRLGNLYKYLGALSETRRAWREAHRLTKDPGLARDLANLR